MAIVELVVPQIGESIKTAFIGRWLKPAGSAVAAGEPVLELDSDKASLEVPAPTAGVLTEVLFEEGDEVDIGATVARIDPEAAPAVAEPAQTTALTAPAAPATPDNGAGRAATPSDKGPQTGPAARQVAAGSGVDIGAVEGTGTRGRVLSRDVEAAASQAVATGGQAVQAPTVDPSVLEERVPMTPLRRTIARRLVEAQQTAAMLTTFNEIDMGEVIALRKRYQDRFVKRYGRKLGFMSFFVKAAIEALKEYPAVNAQIDGNDIVYKRYYNIGVAVSTERGLMVPVVRDADRLSFAETEATIAELAGRGRDGKLKLADFQGGTFTISNGGIYGSLMSTPILNPPQVGILGMHTIQQRPVERNGEIVLRPMMYVAMSYDHRIIDGREAVQFLVKIKECVEAPERILLEV